MTTVPIELASARDPKRYNLKRVRFLPDTGANITGIPRKTMREMGILERQLGYRSGIQAPKTADGRSNLQPIGIMRGIVKLEGRSMELDVYVMDNLSQPILSRAACIGLGIFSSKLISGQSQ